MASPDRVCTRSRWNLSMISCRSFALTSVKKGESVSFCTYSSRRPNTSGKMVDTETSFADEKLSVAALSGSSRSLRDLTWSHGVVPRLSAWSDA